MSGWYQMLYSEHVLPHQDHWIFHYPDLVRRKKVGVAARAATLEMLTGPWITLSYPANGTESTRIHAISRIGTYAEEFRTYSIT